MHAPRNLRCDPRLNKGASEIRRLFLLLTKSYFGKFLVSSLLVSCCVPCHASPIPNNVFNIYSNCCFYCKLLASSLQVLCKFLANFLAKSLQEFSAGGGKRGKVDPTMFQNRSKMKPIWPRGSARGLRQSTKYKKIEKLQTQPQR